MPIVKFDRTTEVEVTTLRLVAKEDALFLCELYDVSGQIIDKDDEGYAPLFVPDNGEHCVDLKIDLATGKILNWIPPAAEQLEDWYDRYGS